MFLFCLYWSECFLAYFDGKHRNQCVVGVEGIRWRRGAKQNSDWGRTFQNGKGTSSFLGTENDRAAIEGGKGG